MPAAHEYGDDALSAKAFTLDRAGRKKEAAEAFAQLAKTMPSSPFAAEARLNAGKLFVEIGEGARASEMLGGVKGAGTAAEQEAKLALGEGAMQDSKPAEAEQHFRAALAGPDAGFRGRARLGLADALSEQGKVEEAGRLYAEAAKDGASEADYALAALVVTEFNRKRWTQVVEAGVDFEKRFGGSSHRPGVLYALAESLFALERWDEARGTFEKLGVADPSRAAVCASRRAWCDFQQGRTDRALEGFTDFVRRYPDDPAVGEAYVVLGRVQLQRERPEAAERFYTEALKRGSVLGEYADDCRLGLARALARREMIDRALEEYDRFEKDHGDSPSLASALYEAAELRYRRDEHAAAEKGYRKVRQSFPRHELAPYALHGEGWCALDQGDAERAEKHARDLASLQHEALATPALELLAASLRAQGRDGDAAEVYARLAATQGGSDPRSIDAAVKAAVLRRQAGDAERSRIDLAALLARNPEMQGRERVLYELALSARAADDGAAAERAWRQLAKDHAGTPEASDARFQLGELAYDASKFEEAETWYSAAIAAPRDASLKELASYKRGWSRLQLGRFGEAGVDFDRVVAENPEGELAGESLFLAGECRYRAEDYEAARQRLSRVLREFPGHDVSSRAQFRLGLCQGHREDWKACQESLRQLLDAHPEFKAAAEARLWIGRSFRMLDQAKQGLEVLEQAYDDATGDLIPRVKIEAGRCCMALEDFKAASRRFLEVRFTYDTKFSELAAEATFLAAESYLAQDDRESAEKFYRDLIKTFPRNALVARARERLSEIDRG